MPRKSRHTQTPARLPDREHVALLEAMAKSFTQLMPDYLRFTIAIFDNHGRMAGFISNSGRPFAFAPQRRRPSFRQRFPKAA